MAETKLSAYGTLIQNKLIAFGVPAADASRILADGRMSTPGERGNELNLRFIATKVRFLDLAEHIARVFHDWNRCYRVDTTRLAMAALSKAGA